TSEQYADERYADQLDRIKTFESRLQAELAAFSGRELNELEKKRQEGLLKMQQDLADKRQSEEDRQFADLLKQYATYEQKRQKIIADGERKVAALRKAGKLAEAENAKKDTDTKLQDLEMEDSGIKDVY